jgi:hypothetical protein
MSGARRPWQPGYALGAQAGTARVHRGTGCPVRGHAALEFAGTGRTVVSLSPSFWRTGPGLRGADIDNGYSANRLAPGTGRKPPVMELEHTSVNCSPTAPGHVAASSPRCLPTAEVRPRVGAAFGPLCAARSLPDVVALKTVKPCGDRAG